MHDVNIIWNNSDSVCKHKQHFAMLTRTSPVFVMDTWLSGSSLHIIITNVSCLSVMRMC